jgi:heme oxygenase
MQGRRHVELRRTTAALHQELDGIVDREDFFGSVDRYASYLARLHLFHGRVEPLIAGSGDPAMQEWLHGDRVGWLAADLRDLGRTPPSAGPEEPGALPSLPSPAARLGALYVIVGSALGARMLVRRLDRLDMPAGGAARYLSGLGAFDRWKAFLAHLEAAPIDAEGDLLDGALATFESARLHLSGPLPP